MKDSISNSPTNNSSNNHATTLLHIRSRYEKSHHICHVVLLLYVIFTTQQQEQFSFTSSPSSATTTSSLFINSFSWQQIHIIPSSIALSSLSDHTRQQQIHKRRRRHCRSHSIINIFQSSVGVQDANGSNSGNNIMNNSDNSDDVSNRLQQQQQQQVVGVVSMEAVPVQSFNNQIEIDDTLPLNIESTSLSSSVAVTTTTTVAVDSSSSSSSSNNNSDIIQPDYDLLRKNLFNAILLGLTFGYAAYTIFNIDHGMTRGWTQSEIAMRIPLDNWLNYESSLNDRPIATKTAINVIIYLLGDWLSQTAFSGNNILNFDAARTIRNGFIGLCFGPLVHEYYQFSDHILPVDGGMFIRLQKIIMDQTIYLSVKCSIYISAVGLLQGDDIATVKDNVQTKLPKIVLTAWKFWPLVHLVTYGVIPARHRILWVNCVDLIWNAILATMSQKKTTETEDDADDISIEILTDIGDNTMLPTIIYEATITDEPSGTAFSNEIKKAPLSLAEPPTVAAIDVDMKK